MEPTERIGHPHFGHEGVFVFIAANVGGPPRSCYSWNYERGTLGEKEKPQRDGQG
jgi:hypothetical protein